MEPTEQNFERLQTAFKVFGIPSNAIIKEHFLNTSQYDVYTFGRPPACREILTRVKGLDFTETYDHSFDFEDGDMKIKVIHFNHLIQAKKAAGRSQDLNDIEKLNG